MSWFRRVQEFLTVHTPEAERDRLERLVAIVDHHIKSTWPAVGAALAEIHDRQLYRMTHETWAGFLRDRWDISDSHAHRMMAAANLHSKVVAAGKVPPVTPRLARPIAALPEEDQVPAWEDALSLAGNDDVRPEHVEVAVARRSKKGATKSGRRPKVIRLRVPGGVVTIEPGRGFTSAADALEAAVQVLANQAARAA